MRFGPLLLVPLLAGCGYVLGTAEGEPVPDPEFRLLRLAPGLARPRDRDSIPETVLLHADGRIRVKGRTMSERMILEHLYKMSEMKRDVEVPPPRPSLVLLSVVADARAGWSAFRPMLHAAADPDVRFRHAVLVADPGKGWSTSEVPFFVARRIPGTARFAAWGGGAPRRVVGLTANAAGGVDAKAVAARVGVGPILLLAADEVPAQVVADVLGALLRAGAGPVMLAADPPEPGGEETLPGVVIR